jgi:hypothetical protein
VLIRRIAVEDVGVHAGRVEVVLGPGANVVAGPNEAGKSTLVRALGAALTLPARSTSAERRRLVARSGGDPVVEVELEHGGSTFRLRKVFAERRGTCELVEARGGAETRLTSDAAEARLAEVLAEGGPRPSLLPLVWPEQGAAARDPATALDGATRDALSAELAAIVGASLAGHGAEEVVGAVEEECEEYFTEKGAEVRRAAAPLARARAVLERAGAAHAELRARADAHEADATRHAEIERQLVANAAARPVADEAAAAAAREEERLAELRSRVEAAQATLGLARAAREQADRLVRERANARHDAVAAAGERDAAASRAEAARVTCASHDQARAGLASALEERREAERDRERLHLRLRAALEVARAGQVREEAARAESRARALAEAARAAEAALAEVPAVGAGAVRGAEELDRQLQAAEAARDAAAARVTILPEAPIELELDGERIFAPAGVLLERLAAGRLQLAFPGVARVTVEAGGGAGALEEKAAALRARLAAALAALNVPTVEAARDALGRRQAAEASAREAKGLLLTAAPDGLAALEARLARAEDEAAAAAAAFKALDRPGDPAPPPFVELRPAAVAAEATARASLAARGAAERALTEHGARARELAAAADGEARAAAQHAAAAEKASVRLALHEREHGADAALATATEKARQDELARGAAARALADEQTALSGPEAARRRAEARKSRERLRAEAEALRHEQAELAGRLGAADLAGLHERLADAAAARDAAQAEVDRQLAQGTALKLLRDTLQSCKQSSLTAFLPALAREVEPLLAELFPGARVELDAKLGTVRVERPGRGSDRFDELSEGAREQLALAVRAALARALGRSGGGVPLLLDDALVATDDDRFERACALLRRAAASGQVIVLTCHGERYRRLGAAREVALGIPALRAVPGLGGDAAA